MRIVLFLAFFFIASCEEESECKKANSNIVIYNLEKIDKEVISNLTYDNNFEYIIRLSLDH